VGLIVDGGSTPAERSASMPCDVLMPMPDAVLHRTCDVDASAAVAWRWLCQMRFAPYSYDLLDNRGRRSPRALTAGADEDLEPGRTVMQIFQLEAYERDRSLTLSYSGRAFGDLAVTYAAVPLTDLSSRYVVRLLIRYPGGAYGWLSRRLLPAGDLVMMRKQLRTFASLAARTQREQDS
jgi:hypothetical protein